MHAPKPIRVPARHFPLPQSAVPPPNRTLRRGADPHGDPQNQPGLPALVRPLLCGQESATGRQPQIAGEPDSRLDATEKTIGAKDPAS